jgi:hypothetical protein
MAPRNWIGESGEIDDGLGYDRILLQDFTGSLPATEEPKVSCAYWKI